MKLWMFIVWGILEIFHYGFWGMNIADGMFASRAAFIYWALPLPILVASIAYWLPCGLLKLAICIGKRLGSGLKTVEDVWKDLE